MRFYGQSWREWMTETPLVAIRACVAMLPRLEATEALRGAEVAAIGGGTLAADVRTKTLNRWAREASTSTSSRPAPRPTVGRLAHLGIGMVTRPRRRPGSDHAE